ncbi:hypothetical protein Ddye_022605 [Dipteronia dyeriana]|uniref:Uncharacterized protein n=1 Tax=Dipteronia dyeriana TaxID=168575 RepID=A0AAD9TRV0_9ROSI|nr:hypothetical protein Ddye_022605 [Dipteronia dyeriana]
MSFSPCNANVIYPIDVSVVGEDPSSRTSPSTRPDVVTSIGVTVDRYDDRRKGSHSNSSGNETASRRHREPALAARRDPFDVQISGRILRDSRQKFDEHGD